MHSVRLEPLKSILIGTRPTYQATVDAGFLCIKYFYIFLCVIQYCNIASTRRRDVLKYDLGLKMYFKLLVWEQQEDCLCYTASNRHHASFFNAVASRRRLMHAALFRTDHQPFCGKLQPGTQ